MIQCSLCHLSVSEAVKLLCKLVFHFNGDCVFFKYFEGTLGSLAMVEDQCSAGNIILKRTGENIRYCKVVDVISIANEVSTTFTFHTKSMLLQ